MTHNTGYPDHWTTQLRGREKPFYIGAEMFKVIFEPGWDKFFSKFEKAERERILKKINQLAYFETRRHLGYGAPYFVAEAGQYRVCYEETGGVRKVIFAGNHKQYEKWLESL